MTQIKRYERIVLHVERCHAHVRLAHQASLHRWTHRSCRFIRAMELLTSARVEFVMRLVRADMCDRMLGGAEVIQ